MLEIPRGGSLFSFDFEHNNFNWFQLKLVAKNATIFKISEPSRTPDWLPCVHMHVLEAPAHAEPCTCAVHVECTSNITRIYAFGGYEWRQTLRKFKNCSVFRYQFYFVEILIELKLVAKNATIFKFSLSGLSILEILEWACRRISGCCLHLDNVWDKLYVFLQWIKASSRSSKTNLQRHLNKHLFISLSSLIEFGDFPPDINYCWSQKNDFPTIPFESKFFKAFWKQVIKHISKPLNQVHSLHLWSSSS